MPISAATLRQIASLPPRVVAKMLLILADQEEIDEKRRENQRDRTRRSREKSVTVTLQANDSNVTPPPRQEKSPTPPKETQPSPISESRRARDDEFDEFFWPNYPHKVGKPEARKAWPRARTKASLDAIMAGLRRYVELRSPDRIWLNPATFLNQERWDDEPNITGGNGGRSITKTTGDRARELAAELRRREADGDTGNSGPALVVVSRA